MNSLWTEEEILALSEKFHIHPGYRLHAEAEDYHFPRQSFLRDGYATSRGYLKDFSVFWHEGRLHMFHIVGHPGEVCWVTGNEISFGHASTSDLSHWIRHPMPLAVGEHPWESEHIWAPYIYRHGGVFYLFYMGSGRGQTFISYATSRDLEEWTRWPEGPIISAVGRNPFLFEDAGRTILLYTGRNGAQICACASRDMVTWEPLPDLLNIPESVAAESVSLHSYKGGFVLWFNDYGAELTGFRAAYAFSDDPFHFEPRAIRKFEFRSDGPEPALNPEVASAQESCPVAIELVGRKENRWLVSYFRWQGIGPRLFFGEILWEDEPAVLQELTDPEKLPQIFRDYQLPV